MKPLVDGETGEIRCGGCEGAPLRLAVASLRYNTLDDLLADWNAPHTGAFYLFSRINRLTGWKADTETQLEAITDKVYPGGIRRYYDSLERHEALHAEVNVDWYACIPDRWLPLIWEWARLNRDELQQEMNQ